MQKDLKRQQEWESNGAIIDNRVTGLYTPMNDGYMVLHVGAPELRKQTIGSDFHEYPITGVDSNGDIECARRYNLFFEFR